MKVKRKQLVAVLVMFFVVSTLAIFISAILGRAYLNILNSGEPKASPAPRTNTTPVINREDFKTLELTPVPVFFLQGGIYNDIEGARKTAEEFMRLGVDPYIPEQAPYRLFIGFFSSREAADQAKADLSEKGVSTFTQSQVLNPTALKYRKENEALVKRWSPLLEDCSQLLLTNGFSIGTFEKADRDATLKSMEAFSVQLVQVIKTNKVMTKDAGQIDIQGEAWAEALTGLQTSISDLEKEWTQRNYDRVAKGLINLVQTYTECWGYLTEPSKT